MSYFERQEKMRLYEAKLKQKSIQNEEVLTTKKDIKPFKVGSVVEFEDDDYIVKFCEGGNCVIEKDGKQQFIDCNKATLKKDSTLDENKNKSLYTVEAYNKDADTYREFLSTPDYE